MTLQIMTETRIWFETDYVKHGEVITEKKRRRGESNLAGTGGKQKKK